MKPKCHFSESFLHRQGGKLWAWLQGSVEERIMEIIKQRKAGQQPGSRQEAEKEPQKFKRNQQDMTSSLKADRQNLRTAELEHLFRVGISSDIILSRRTA